MSGLTGGLVPLDITRRVESSSGLASGTQFLNKTKQSDSDWDLSSPDASPKNISNIDDKAGRSDYLFGALGGNLKTVAKPPSDGFSSDDSFGFAKKAIGFNQPSNKSFPPKNKEISDESDEIESSGEHNMVFKRKDVPLIPKEPVENIKMTSIFLDTKENNSFIGKSQQISDFELNPSISAYKDDSFDDDRPHILKKTFENPRNNSGPDIKTIEKYPISLKTEEINEFMGHLKNLPSTEDSILQTEPEKSENALVRQEEQNWGGYTPSFATGRRMSRRQVVTNQKLAPLKTSLPGLSSSDSEKDSFFPSTETRKKSLETIEVLQNSNATQRVNAANQILENSKLPVDTSWDMKPVPNREKFGTGFENTKITEYGSVLKGADLAELEELRRQLDTVSKEKETASIRHATEESRLRKLLEDTRSKQVDSMTRVAALESELSQYKSLAGSLENEKLELLRKISIFEASEEDSLARIEAEQRRHEKEMEIRLDKELNLRDQQHASTLNALRKVHLDELNMVRHNAGDAKQLESLANQVQASVDALKQLQGKVMQQVRGADVVHAGQIEARERLVGELEGNARRSQLAAEQEILRLHGILAAMELVMGSLRGQTSEEHERLRQEHIRLEAMGRVTACESEAAREGIDEERRRLAERWANFEEEKRRSRAEIVALREEVESERAEMLVQRREIEDIKAKISASQEHAAKHAGVHGERIASARAQLAREAEVFEARLEGAKEELRAAERATEGLRRTKREFDETLGKLKTAEREVLVASERVAEKSAEAEQTFWGAKKFHENGLVLAREAQAEKQSLKAQSSQIEENLKELKLQRIELAKMKANAAKDWIDARRLRVELHNKTRKIQNGIIFNESKDLPIPPRQVTFTSAPATPQKAPQIAYTGIEAALLAHSHSLMKNIHSLNSNYETMRFDSTFRPMRDPISAIRAPLYSRLDQTSTMREPLFGGLESMNNSALNISGLSNTQSSIASHDNKEKC